MSYEKWRHARRQEKNSHRCGSKATTESIGLSIMYHSLLENVLASFSNTDTATPSCDAVCLDGGNKVGYLCVVSFATKPGLRSRMETLLCVLTKDDGDANDGAATPIVITKQVMR
jgi:hypothetical protein